MATISDGSIPTPPASTPPIGSRATGANFHRLWLGQGISLLGSATTAILMPLLAIQHLDAGPGWMGALTAATWLPWLVIGLPAGAWVDRLPPRRVMITANLAAGAAVLTIPLAWWAGVLSLVQMLAVALACGTATVFFHAAYAKLIPLIVPGPQLESANARLFGTESAAQIAGPGVGGVLTQLLSAVVGIVGDAVSFVVSAICLARIRLEPAPTAVAKPSVARLGAQIREGVRVVVRDRNLRVLVVLGSISNFGLTGYAALLVLFLVRDLHLSPGALGLVLMVGSAGGLLGASLATGLARRIGTGRASTALLLVSGPPALLIGSPSGPGQVWLTVTGLLLVGAAVVAGNVIRGAWRQRYVPGHLMGRVLTTSQVLNYGTMPLAGVAAGWLGTHLGTQTTILLMAGVHCLACWSILLTRLGRLRNLPDWDASQR
ncbi:MAG: MFS transporter [Propionibacteriaceae bacterium]